MAIVPSRKSFLSSAAAAGSMLAAFPRKALAQPYAPPYQLGGSVDLGHQGELRSIRFAPERGPVPVECLAAMLPRASFAATLVEELDRDAGYSAVLDVARASHASVAINGGFFTFNPFTPDGLLVIAGKTISRPRPDFSGAIAIDHEGALSVVPTRDARRAEFAVQGHPMLVENGGKMGMHTDAGERTVRTFVAQSGGVIIVAVTSPVTLYHLADVLVQYPDAFGLRQIDAALNLSGDATTSFYARLPDGSEVMRKSSWPNRDVLIFEPRHNLANAGRRLKKG